MPSEKALKQKQELVAALSEKLKTAVSGVVVDYKGISVDNDTKLRRELRAAGVEYTVVKNTVLLRAAKEVGFDALESVLEGTTALAVSSDYTSAAKILCGYADKSKGAFSVKAGFIEGRVVEKQEVESLAKLPSKEQLVAQVLGGLNAPISGMVYVLSANITGLARALGAIAAQKEA